MSRINVGETLDQDSMGRYQKLILLFTALAFAMDGLANQALGLSIPSLMQDWGVSRDQFASVTGLGLLGVALGAALGGMLGDKIGRRWALIASVLLFGVVTMATAKVNSLGMLTILRSLDGLGIGAAIPNAIALLTECLPTTRRSLGIGVSMVFIPVGATLAGSLATYVLPEMGWQALFFIGGLAPLLLGILFLFVLPESPRYLALRPERWPELRILLAKFGYQYAADVEFSDEAPKRHNIPLSMLFLKDICRDTVFLWCAFFFCFIASYSMFSWGPVMMTSQGFDLEKMGLGLTSFSFGGITGGVISGWAIARFGSRNTLMFYGSGGLIAAGLLAWLFPKDPTAISLLLSCLAVLGFFTAGMLNMVYTVAASMYEPFIRGTGVGASAAVGRLGAVASSFIGIAALNLGGAFGFFVLIGLCTACTLVLLLMVQRQLTRVI
jgi:MFS transporter, AAHS family, 4-hydroxybenzoate transporter